MKLLAFDTSSAVCSVALLHGDEEKVLYKSAVMQQARVILPMIQELLGSSSLKLTDLDAITYGCGPGSFTGIRIASSVAQGLGFAAKLPVIRISSLAAIAQAAFLEQQWSNLLIALDARMDQIYWAIYKMNKHGCAELIGQEQLCDPAGINIPGNSNYYGIGDGWEKHREKIEMCLGFKLQVAKSSRFPLAQAILRLAKAKFDKGDWVAASEAIPVYLR